MATTTRSGVFSTSYRDELALTRGLPAHLGSALVAVAALVFPLVAGKTWQPIGVFALIAAIGAVGLQLLTGLAGQVSLGHAAFLGVGAYTASWLGVERGLPVYVWLPVAGLVAAAVGAVVGPVATRLRGLYLAVVTLALSFILTYIFEVWDDLTGGSVGRSTMPLTINGTDLLDGVTIFGLDLNGNQAYWYAVLAVLVVMGYAARNIQRTRIGRAFLSVRERDLAASVAGVPVALTKTAAFVVSSFYAGVAGALLAAYQSYVLPTQWGLSLSIQYIAMIVIGGLGSVAGAVIGAAFVTGLPELVRSLTGLLPFIEEENTPTGGITVELVSQLLYGVVIVAVLVFEPAGLMGLWRRFRSFWTTWPWSY
jgi:branched-chain amino acid transport system permease protein